jgi:hypothetical protein
LELLMSELSLPELESRRTELYARLAALGDFRRGSVSENYRKCGRLNCACARPGHRGHGPRWLWTRTVAGRGTRGRQVAAGEVEKVRGEVGRYQEFAALTEQIVEVNEAICEARPALPETGSRAPAAQGLEQLRAQVRAEIAAEVERLAAAAVRPLSAGGGAGLEAVELVIHAAMTTVAPRCWKACWPPIPATAARGRLRGRAPGRVRVLPGQDRRYGGRPGHGDPGLVSLVACGHGLAPRDTELEMAGETMSRGLARMTAWAGAAETFAKASGLLADLAGVAVSARRVERSAEADGTAAAAAIGERAAAIAARMVIPCRPLTCRTSCTSPSTAPACPWSPLRPRAGRARAKTAKLAPARPSLHACPGHGRRGRYPVRDPGSSSYVAAFAPAAAFGKLMAAEGRRCGAAHVRQLTILGDGAVRIWNLASEYAAASSSPATSRRCCQPPAPSP